MATSTVAVLLFSAALIFSVSAAATDPVEDCVKLVFDPPPETQNFWKSILCRDLLRKTGKTFKETGILSPEYLTALNQLPRFKNDPAELNAFLCELGPPQNAAVNLGCSVDVTEPNV